MGGETRIVEGNVSIRNVTDESVRRIAKSLFRDLICCRHVLVEPVGEKRVIFDSSACPYRERRSSFRIALLPDGKGYLQRIWR